MLAGLSLATGAQAACPGKLSRFVGNGAEVMDRRTGLAWQRCSSGQNWDGTTCKGSALRLTHAEALDYAKSLNPNETPNGWRLPQAQELVDLASGACPGAGIDKVLSTATPTGQYWTSSTDSGYSYFVLVVGAGDGQVGKSLRSLYYQVRLVRTIQ